MKIYNIDKTYGIKDFIRIAYELYKFSKRLQYLKSIPILLRTYEQNEIIQLIEWRIEYRLTLLSCIVNGMINKLRERLKSSALERN